MKKFQIFVIFLTFSLINSSSGVLLTGMMFTYLARGLLSSLADNTIKTVYTTTLPNGDGMTSTSSSNMDTMNTISQVVRALGLGRAIKDLFTEDEDCAGRKCNKGKKKRKKKRSDDSSEEDDYEKPLFHDTEDYSRYIIRGKTNDPEEIANDLLSEDDPMNFYYVMKDTQKRHRKQKQGRTPQLKPQGGTGQGRPGGHQGQRVKSPHDPKSPQPPPPPLQQLPMFRRGRFPIFIRYRKRTPGYTRFK